MRIRLRRGYGGQVADCGLQQGQGSISDKIEMSANTECPLFIPVILGTARQGRQSENVAHFVFEQTKKRGDVETELIDVRELPMRLDNHGYPGLLKHALDMNLKEYIHKAVGICGVSAGPFGGARVIEGLLPVMRELGLVTIYEDVNFAKVGTLFDEHGKFLDQSYVRRVDKFLNELTWMARVLRHGRKNIPDNQEAM